MGFMKILVTGGSGFIGSSLSKSLIDLGHEVTIVGVKTESLIHPKSKFLHLGIESSINKNLKQDCVFHLAANNDTLCCDKEEMFRNNLLEPINLFNSLYRNGCKKFIYASTTAVYGNMPAPFEEEKTKPDPLNFYAESKYAFEKFAEEFCKSKKDISVIGLRYCNVYGMGEFHKNKRASMIYQIYNQIKNEEEVKVFKYGEQKRDWCYIDDVVAANVCCLEYNKSNIFNVASGKSHSFNIIIQIIENYLGKKARIKFIDCDFKEKLQTNTECNIDKAKNELGWYPKYNIREGIKDYINKLENII